MKYSQPAIALLLGGFAIYAETRPVKEYSLFLSWTNSLPVVGLGFLTLVFFVINFRQFRRQEKLVSFLPFLVSSILLIVLVGLIKFRDSQDNAATRFFADSDIIGNDGGSRFDFKKDGHLKATRNDHWLQTCYWGKYRAIGDTIELDIPLNFPLPQKAILKDSVLRFIGDTISFKVFRPLEDQASARTSPCLPL